eukprot:SAG31_NODE_1733_length_7417_cov_1.994397_5_plen_151_part_00
MHVLHRHIAAAELPHSGMLPQASRSSATVPEGIEVRSRMLELMDGTLPVDPMTGIPDPAPLIRLRSAMADAAAAGQYKLALGLNQLLFAVEPRPPVSLEECVGGNTMAEKAAFFDKHGVRSTHIFAPSHFNINANQSGLRGRLHCGPGIV